MIFPAHEHAWRRSMPPSTIRVQRVSSAAARLVSRRSSLAALRALQSGRAKVTESRYVDPSRIAEGLRCPQRLLEAEAEALHRLGFPVAETYVRAASISIGHAVTYVFRGLEAEGRGAAPPDTRRGLIDWL